MKNPIKYFGNELKYLKRVLNSEQWSSNSGNWNKALEENFAKKIGVKYAIAMNSGTSTLHCALEAVGVKPGDEVITPALTVIMDTTSIIHANAIPVYVDIDENTLTIDIQDLKRKITDKTKAIIVVSLYGMPFDFDKIKEVAGNIPIIEDNAQATLSYYKGKILGTMGDMASFSFENTKHLSCGEGGILVTNNEIFAEKARKISNHGFKNQTASEGRTKLNLDIFQNPNYKRHECIGWNYRLSEFNAAVALAQLEKSDYLVNLRKENAKIFLEVMSDKLFKQQRTDSFDYTHTYYTLGTIYKGNENFGITWEEFRNLYIKNGGDGIYGSWSVQYLEPVMFNKQYKERNPIIYNDIDYNKGICPTAEEVQPKIMQFKTNYRDIKLAKYKANILKKTIDKVIGK
jgi:perosamine synthetase